LLCRKWRADLDTLNGFSNYACKVSRLPKANGPSLWAFSPRTHFHGQPQLFPGLLLLSLPEEGAPFFLQHPNFQIRAGNGLRAAFCPSKYPARKPQPSRTMCESGVFPPSEHRQGQAGGGRIKHEGLWLTPHLFVSRPCGFTLHPLLQWEAAC
jgi:hypothetical protein